MKQSNRLLKMLVATAIGILLFSGAVFAILNLTGTDSNKKSSTATSQKAEDKSKKEKTSVKEEKKEEKKLETTESSEENINKEKSINNNSTNIIKEPNGVKNASTSNNVVKEEKKSEDKVVETAKPEEKITTNIEDNSNYVNGRVYEYNGKKLSPIAGTGNTGKVFSSQAEASAYGQAEVEKRVKETKKYTSYSVGRVLYEDGSQAGWTVDIYNGSQQ